MYLNTAYAAHYVYSEFKIRLSYLSADEEGIHKPTFWDLLPFVLYRLTVSTIKKAQQRRQFLKEEKIRLKLIEEEEERERERAKEAGKKGDIKRLYMYIISFYMYILMYMLCTFYIYILYVHFICTFYMYILYVHFIYTFYMYILYVHFICTFYMYILYVLG